MTCPVCGPRKGKKRRDRQAEEAPDWEAVAAAIALITAERAGSGDRVADLIGDQPPTRVLRAQALLTRVVLDVLVPELGTRTLQYVGLRALERTTR